MRKLHEITWVAGLLEGEGYFGFSRTPSIQVTSTDLDTIQKYKKIIITGIQIRVQSETRGNRKTPYRLEICGTPAIEWMFTIYSIMSSRRKEQIKEVIEQWKSMKNSNVILGVCKRGHSLSGLNLKLKLNGDKICRTCERHQANLRRWRIKENEQARIEL